MHGPPRRGEHLCARALGIAVGAVADRIVADPSRLHPVAGFGAVAARLESVLNRAAPASPSPGSPAPDRCAAHTARAAGTAYTLVLVGSVVAAGAAAQRVARRLSHPAARVAGEATVVAAAVWTALGGTSLLRVAGAVRAALDSGDDDAARDWLPWLCGRDPQALDRQEMARAVVESLAENTSDAQVAPLWWAAVGGVPGVLGYRAANTLDAMVGHRSERHRYFGWSAARLDDLLNLIPARVAGALTVLGAPAAGGGRWAAARTWARDAAAHPSPNAGVVEAAAAGALGVRLGGRTPYPYGTQDRPVLGADGREVAVTDIGRAIRLERRVQDAAAVLAVGGVALVAVLRSGFARGVRDAVRPR